jgi:dTDP-4-dehydrorhamnose reductase
VKILLTGAGGQLGDAVRATFIHHEVVAHTRQDLDACDLAAVRRALASVRPDLVLNAAGYTDVDGAEESSDEAFAGNALAPRNLALATAEQGLPLVHLSSDYVFDGTAKRPYHEFDAPCPLSVYGRSKLAGEEAVRSLNPRHYVVRTAWLFGSVRRNFALTMRSLADRREVRVVSDQFGSPTYAPHLAAALERLVETDAYGTYHLAGSGTASWYEVAEAIFRALGAHTSVRPIPTAAFPGDADRPHFSALTTLQDPRLILPPWEQGVKEFATASSLSNAGPAGDGAVLDRCRSPAEISR